MTETSPLTNRSPIVSDPVTVPPQPSVRGESLLRRCENVWLHLDRLAARFLPSALNPFGQLGAIANTCLLAAVVSGIALLIWYTPSVTNACDSLEKLRAGSWLGQLVRSLHRYSSEGCIFFSRPRRLICANKFCAAGGRWKRFTACC